MAVAYMVETTMDEAVDREADIVNPVVVATEKSWQSLLLSHTPLSTQFVPAMWRAPHARSKALWLLNLSKA